MAKDWLIKSARKAGLVQSEEYNLNVDTLSIADAWGLVSKAFGVTPDDLARHVAAFFGLDVADFDTADPRAARLVPERFARRHEIFPLREHDRALQVATCDPTDLDTEHSLAFASGLSPVFTIASPDAIKQAIKRGYTTTKPSSRLVDSILSGTGDSGKIDAVLNQVRVMSAEEDRQEPERQEARDIDDGPIVKLANLILVEAINRRASDIHIGPGPGGGAVRFRIDGVLQDYMQMPLSALNRVNSRIKIIGNLDITDRLRPQDGRSRIVVDDQNYDLRISTVPTRDAENVVIRILDPRGARRFKDIDFTLPELDRFRQLLSHRSGIVIVTGPTGSGKTTTLYAGIGELATGDVNIMTVEDPVEYELPGVTQIQVETERDVTFASALRAILRQDPDVIFVGEIRDLETAQVAVQASTTGHLVLATLHTNNALGIISRLSDLGLDLFTIESVLRGAMGQRLVRRLCKSCARPIGPDDPLLPEDQALAERYGVRPVMRAVGCDQCLVTGYRGRIPVAEVFVMDNQLAERIAKGASPIELERVAVQNGMRPMLKVALERVRAGETTLQEVARVLGQVAEEVTPVIAPRVSADAGEAAPPAPERPSAPVVASPAPRDDERVELPVGEAAHHILVVDDDPMTRRFVRALLEHHDFQVTEARNGSAALELLKEGGYSLVLLDLNMPKLGGPEVLSVLRSDRTTSQLPVVVLTAANGTSEVSLLNQGADDFVSKPIVPDRLIARVRANLRRAESSRGR